MTSLLRIIYNLCIRRTGNISLQNRFIVTRYFDISVRQSAVSFEIPCTCSAEVFGICWSSGENFVRVLERNGMSFSEWFAATSNSCCMCASDLPHPHVTQAAMTSVKHSKHDKISSVSQFCLSTFIKIITVFICWSIEHCFSQIFSFVESFWFTEIKITV